MVVEFAVGYPLKNRVGVQGGYLPQSFTDSTRKR